MIWGRREGFPGSWKLQPTLQSDRKSDNGNSPYSHGKQRIRVFGSESRFVLRVSASGTRRATVATVCWCWRMEQLCAVLSMSLKGRNDLTAKIKSGALPVKHGFKAKVTRFYYYRNPQKDFIRSQTDIVWRIFRWRLGPVCQTNSSRFLQVTVL